MNTFRYLITKPVLVLSSRSYSQKKPGCYGPPKVQKTTLFNGINVVAAEILGAPMAACTILYKAGSRYEKDCTLGATHVIRSMSDASGCGYSEFIKCRALQQNGIYLTCHTDRETVSYTLRCPFTEFEDHINFLVDTAIKGCYIEWELEDRRGRMKDDLYRISPKDKVMDLIQKASFTGPLANSIYCVEERIEDLNNYIMTSYCHHQFKPSQCSIAGVGLPFDDVLRVAEILDPSRTKPVPMKMECSKFRSGMEYHDRGPNTDTCIAVAVPGACYKETDNLIKHSIVAAALGYSSFLAGTHKLSRAGESPLGLLSATDRLTTYRPFSISYYEAGLFGIMACTRACTAHQVAESLAKALHKVKDLKKEQIEYGKARLKTSLALETQNPAAHSENLAIQAAYGCKEKSVGDLMLAIDRISDGDVLETAKKLGEKARSLSYAVVGDVGVVPHEKELQKVC